MDQLVYEVGAHYIFDRAYLDFKRLYKLALYDAFFVVRAKINFKFKRMYFNKVDETKEVLCDQIGKVTGFYTSKNYPDKLRVKYYNNENKRTFVFLTNNTSANAENIALLYKKRWHVELFF